MKKNCVIKTIVLCFAFVLFAAALAVTLSACDTSSGHSEPKWYLDVFEDVNDVSGGYDYTVSVLQSSPEGNTVRVPQAKYGNEFLGLYNSDGVRYFDSNGNQVPGTIIDRAMSLYGYWNYVDCDISYYLVDENGETSLYDTDTAAYSSTISSMPVPQLEGKNFLGWYNSFTAGENGGLTYGNAVTDGEGKPLTGFDRLNDKFYKFKDENTAEISLYAQFGVRKLEVTFDFNDGGVTSPVKMQVDYGIDFSELETPVKEEDGRMISGWSSYAAGGIEFAGAITSDITLYAIWREYCTVTLHVTDDDTEDIVIFRGEYYDDEPERGGYEFLGWYPSPLFSGNPVYAISYGNITDYYARWSDPINYTLELIVDDTVYDRYTYNVESEGFLLPVLEDRNGAAFMGWCKNEDLSDEPVYEITYGTYGITRLYPKWHDYTELYCYNDDLTYEVLEIKFGSRYSITPPEEQDDKVFVCWYAVIDGEEVALTDEEGNGLGEWNYTYETLDVYAKYRHYITVSVSYSVIGGDDVVTVLGTALEGDSVTVSRPMALGGYDTEFYIDGVKVGEGSSFVLTAPSADVTVEVRYTLPKNEELSEKLGFNVYSYNGHYYAAIKYKASGWHDAEAYCEFLGGHLATITTEGEQNAVAITLSAEDPGNYNYWLGASDEAEEGKWQWVTGEAFGYTFWGGKEPSGGSEDFLEFYGTYPNYGWNDSGDNRDNYVVCEWDNIRSVIVPDTRTFTDIDGEEITLEIYSYGNHYYAFVTEAKLWTDAEKYAEYLGGYLATVANEPENTFLYSVNKYKGYNSTFYLGGSDEAEEGNWQWVFGDAFSYTHWASGEPNNGSGNQDHNTLRTDGYWDDDYNTKANYFIIEWDRLSDMGNIKYGNYFKTISTAEELAALNGSSAGTEARLTSDIDLSGVDWTPFDFNGTLIGDGYGITGLNDSLFATLYGGAHDLQLEVDIAVDYTGSSIINVGALAQKLSNGAVKNVALSGRIISRGAVNIGGLIGDLIGSCSITDCANYASISGTGVSGGGTTGGILGVANTGNTLNEFSGNINYGSVSGPHVGGLIGYIAVTATLSDCTNYGDISGTTQYCGGIVGQATKQITIDGCVSRGEIINENGGGKYVGSGSVTYTNLPVVEINSADDLWLLANNIAQESFILTADIDLSGREWTPIALAASLNGGGFTISGVELTSNATENLAFFTMVSGTLSNITFNDVTVTSTAYESVSLGVVCVTLTGTLTGVTVEDSCLVTGVNATAGALAATISGGTVENCVNYAAVTTNSTSDTGATGGIAGTFSNGTISETQNHGDIAGNYCVGGLAGFAELNVHIADCKNTGTVTGKNGSTGGIAGRWAANVNSTSALLENSGAVTGGDNVGGIFGLIEFSSDYTMNGGYKNSGAVSGSNNVGGLFGKAEAASYRFTVAGDSTNSGEISGYDSVGGIAGYLKFRYISLSGAVNTGDVTAENAYAGGIVGFAGATDYSSVIANSSSSAAISAGFIIGGIAGQAENIVLDGCDNAGSSVTATSYRLESDVPYVYLGGYAGSAGGVINSVNTVDISYDNRGGRVGGIAGYSYNINNFSGSENRAAVYAPRSSYVGGVAGGISVSGNFTLGNFKNSGTVTGADYVGGVIGCIYGNVSVGYKDFNATVTFAAIENSGDITGNNKVGGILGYGYLNSSHNGYHTSLFKLSATRLTNSGDITGQSYVGGLFGHAYSDDSSSAVTEGSSSGAVSAEYYVGGLAGRIENIKLTDCSNAGTSVTATGYVIESDVQYAYVGGYAGFGYSFENCHNASDITYSGSGARIGGIAGYANGAFTDCSNTGTITALTSNAVGGVSGYAEYSGSITFTNIKNSGAVTGADYVGGIIGYIYGNVSVGYNDFNATVTFTAIENSGDITGNNKVGGILGYGYLNSSHNGYHTSLFKLSATRLTNSGDITGESYVGGLFGHAYSDDSSSYIIDYSSTGSVVYTGTDGGEICGKLENISLS